MNVLALSIALSKDSNPLPSNLGMAFCILYFGENLYLFALAIKNLGSTRVTYTMS